MTHWLEADYEGAVIKLAFTESGTARLLINGVEREAVTAKSSPTTLKLGSPVQTGYEHHEFIEAKVQFGTDKIDAILTTGDDVLALSSVVVGS